MKARMPLTFPAILGRDASGTVTDIGPGVSGFIVGARVMGLVNAAYAEYVVAPAAAWALVPASMDLVDAAALPLVLLTGAELIEEAVKPKAGDVVLVTGALGSVGRVAVFAAKALGATVWAGVRSERKADAFALGVDGVVGLDDVNDIAKLPPLDAIADTVGGLTIARLLASLKSGGTIASVVGEPVGAAARGLVVRGLLAHTDGKRLAQLARDVAEGRLVIPIVNRLPLALAWEAQTLAERGAHGKVVLKV
jgi:NADPH:quinone reductase-like Zn-dependent oxidoreductase